MRSRIKLDDFLTAQSDQRLGFTATVEAMPGKPTDVEITPFREEHGCGCASSFVLPESMIRSVTSTEFAIPRAGLLPVGETLRDQLRRLRLIRRRRLTRPPINRPHAPVGAIVVSSQPR
jgi:hypothetical protein